GLHRACALDELEVDHRMAAMRPTLHAGGKAGAASYATLGIDKKLAVRHRAISGQEADLGDSRFVFCKTPGQAPGYEPRARDREFRRHALSTRTALTLYSGILEIGSTARCVSRLADCLPAQ